MTAALAPASPSPRFLKFFGGYACRLLRKRFASVRIERTGVDILSKAQSHDGPLIIAMNHPSWWDPLVGVALRDTYFQDRPAISPIEMVMFERFRFMRKLGMFGIDPEHPDALNEMVRYVVAQCEEHPGTALFITPQGEFSDVREKIVVRPGVGAIASALKNAHIVALSLELVFWHDKRPELLLLARDCSAPRRPSTPSWTRHIRTCMQSGADELAQLAIKRETQAFELMLTQSGSSVNPAFDLWQRVLGRSARVTPIRRGARV